MHMSKKLFLFAITVVLVVSCKQQPDRKFTPWGTPVEMYTDDGGIQLADSVAAGQPLSLADIQHGGELIMLTLTGPDTYYDYHGRGMGLAKLLCEDFAQHIGVSLRVEVCQDTVDMLHRLDAGEGDVVAFPLPRGRANVLYCGCTTDSLHTQWAVKAGNQELAQALDEWFLPELVVKTIEEEKFALSSKSVTRRVFSPILNSKGGVISRYDALFQKHAPTARWDWRLLAAQCYQESTFDPQARSWVGACGLMQIMPSTAAHLGLPQSMIYDPEANIAAATRYISELSVHFSDIESRDERYNFVLAAYNGGFFHIRDAMTLAQKHGRNPHRWSDVSEFVLKLSQPQYYNDPVVKRGYMRGSETVGYVESIRKRWAQYCGSVSLGSAVGVAGTPTRARHKDKFKIDN